VLAAGSNGTLLEWDGETWTQLDIGGVTDSLLAVWGSSPDEIFAVGANGTALHYQGTSWQPTSTGLTHYLRGVWGSSPDNVFAVSDSHSGTGKIIRWQGSAWTESLSASVPFKAIWGSGPDFIVAVAAGGRIYHFDGNVWTEQSSGTAEDLRGVWGSSPTNVYAVGFDGTVLRWDGFAWGPVSFSDVRHVLEVGGYDAEDFFVAGSPLLFARRQRTCFAAELDCFDEEDEDCDGWVDCADTDCSSETSCQNGGLCEASPLSCGGSISGSTATGPRNLDRYGYSEWIETGREASYRLVAPADGSVTVSLTGLAEDLDLIVLREGPGGGCNPRTPDCVGASSTTSDEVVTFTASGGEAYYIVVDGYASAAGDFTLDVSCP
jgi:hypothetical protein